MHRRLAEPRADSVRKHSSPALGRTYCRGPGFGNHNVYYAVMEISDWIFSPRCRYNHR